MWRICSRPWLPRVKLNCRNHPLITASKVPAHGRHFHHEALCLTRLPAASSMPLRTKTNTNLDRVRKKRRARNSACRKDKMDGQQTIKLTPREAMIKKLLLDVKEYIKQAKGSECSAAQEDMVLRFTGGWVRDKLLGVTSHDIDVAISNMTGLEFAMSMKEYLDDPDNMAIYQNYNNRAITEDLLKIHKIEANPDKSKHLETATTRLFDLDIDLVNLRKETYTEDSRNPQMEFGTAEEDALRRDATVNAMFYNLNTSKLEDFTGLGVEDMRKKLIRTPLEPYQTFKDDPLRVLRLIRFASRLQYRIDENSQKAMQNDVIKEHLKLKISKERVGVEVEKMLQGPDPRTALKYIGDLGLYSVIFANQQDDVEANVDSWSLAYDALDKILQKPENKQEDAFSSEHIKGILVPDECERYRAWVVAAFVPWALVPTRQPRSKNEKPPVMARAAEVARDNLRMENKAIALLKDAATYFREVTSLKTSVISNSIPGTPSEVRQHVGLKIRSWGKDWRMAVVMAILQDIAAGAEYAQVIREYDLFLSYIEKENLLEVTELKPIANGHEISALFGVGQGRWLRSALEMLIKWQLLHPDNSNKEEALEELKARRAELGV